jgi:hypothetical protein
MNKFTTCYKDPLTKTSWRRIGDVVQSYWPKDVEVQIRYHDDRYEARSMVRGGVNDWMPWSVVVANPTETAGVRAHTELLGRRTPPKWYDAKWGPWDRETMASDHTSPKLVRKNVWGNLLWQPGAPSKLYWHSLYSNDVEAVTAIWERVMADDPVSEPNTTTVIQGFDDGSGQLWVTTDDPQVVLGLPSAKWYACELRSDMMFRLKDEGGTWEPWTNSEFDGWATKIAQHFWPDRSPVQGQSASIDTPRTAASFLDAALGHMRDRASTYDKPQGERSMGNCVQAFNQLTGHTLTGRRGPEARDSCRHDQPGP